MQGAIATDSEVRTMPLFIFSNHAVPGSKRVGIDACALDDSGISSNGSRRRDDEPVEAGPPAAPPVLQVLFGAGSGASIQQSLVVVQTVPDTSDAPPRTAPAKGVTSFRAVPATI